MTISIRTLEEKNGIQVDVEKRGPKGTEHEMLQM